MNYEASKEKLFADLDSKLIQSALRLPTVVPENLHHVMMKSSEISSQEDMKNIKRLSAQAKLSGVEYIYSCIKQGDDIVFTSSSATEKELQENKDISHYFDVYSDATKKLREAFTSQKITFDEYTDKWGHFKSVFIPQKSNDGQLYVVCADIKIDFINQELNQILRNSLLEIVFYMTILIPLFAAYFYHNIRSKHLLESEVKSRTNQLKTLLDNADQGFLSFSKEMIIYPEYSEKCTEIFHVAIEGKSISELLFGEDEKEKKVFEENLCGLIGDNDALRVENILSLLRSEFMISKRLITVEYRMIGNDAFMLILTDMTEKRALEKRLEVEKNKLQMVVSAVENSSELFELLDEYSEFIDHRVDLVQEDQSALENLAHIYRSVHTFKGLFAQKDFITTPLGLHKLEEKLASYLDKRSITNEQLVSLLTKVDVKTWLGKDKHVLRQVLGDSFFDPKTREVFGDKSLFAKLSSYQKLTEKLALKLDKHIYPVRIECDKSIQLQEAYKPFIKSLVHLFRNCIDHGIESPEERLLKGKDERGSISCAVSVVDDGWELSLRDDGKGIDTVSVAMIALSKGMITQEQAKQMSDEEINLLIFQDNFSTKEMINELSGRGMGLGAIKYEIEAIGGSFSVLSMQDNGTIFTFFIPKDIVARGAKVYHCNDLLRPIATRTVGFLGDEVGLDLPAKEFETVTQHALTPHSMMVKIAIGGSFNYWFIMGFEGDALAKLVDYFVIDSKVDDDFDAIAKQVACEVANTVLGNAITNFPDQGAGVSITPPLILRVNDPLCKDKNSNICSTEIKTDGGLVSLALIQRIQKR